MLAESETCVSEGDVVLANPLLAPLVDQVVELDDIVVKSQGTFLS